MHDGCMCVDCAMACTGMPTCMCVHVQTNMQLSCPHACVGMRVLPVLAALSGSAVILPALTTDAEGACGME